MWLHNAGQCQKLMIEVILKMMKPVLEKRKLNEEK